MTTRRQRRALDIARAAIGPLSENGLRGSRLADIGEHLGMTGAHLLYYFDSKTALFLTALQVVESDLRTGFENALATHHSVRESWEWLLEAATPDGVNDPNLSLWLEAWSAAAHDEQVRAVVEELEADWQHRLRDLLYEGITRRELPADTAVEDFVEGFSALMDGLALRVVIGYQHLEHAQAVRLCRDFTAPFLHWQTPPDTTNDRRIHDTQPAL